MAASRGADGYDVSRNATGLQARWEDGGSHAGLFLGGSATFHDLARGARPEGPSAFVLAVAEGGPDHHLMTYLWTPRVDQVLRATHVLPPSAAMDAVRDLFRSCDSSGMARGWPSSRRTGQGALAGRSAR